MKLIFSQTITLANAQPIKVTLGEDTQVLDEVVVTALGIKRATKALSYNVQEVKGDELTAVKDANFMNSLSGKVAGVQINSGATGAGGATRVVMRGMKSLTKDNNALYVIDGVPIFNTGKSGGEGLFGEMGGSDAVADLNPDDIASISMMTGPSAAALYGSAAANGVVLITTKKGKTEKTTITVSNSTTFSKAYIMPDMQNRYGTSSGLFSWGELTNRRYNPSDFFETGSNVINSVALSTGNTKNQTYLSASTTNSGGILPNNSYNRYNFTARNTTHFLNDKLTLDIGAQYIFASAELSWKNQLYLTVTGRNDWDSKLAFSKQKSFFYPSVGLSALLSEMVKLPEVISYAKIRGSYTVVASSFDRFLTNPGYEYNSQTHNWANPTVYPMDNMKPEKTKSWEIGLNLKFWGNRFNLDATYYRSNTLNQTFKVDIPSSSGYKQAIVQAGNVQNQGLELALGFNDKWAGFGWSSNATFTLNRNKVKRLASGSVNPVTGEAIQMDEMNVGWLGKENVAPRVILTEGGSMTDIYVYNQLTKDNNGNIKVDQNGNLGITSSNTPVKVGNLDADFNLGWTNHFTYKGIDLGVVLSARVGGLAYSATQGILDYYGVSGTSATARDNGGIPINNGKVNAQKYYQTIGTGEGGYGRYYLYSATNVRLQELSLNYTLPKRWFKNVANVTLGIVGRNLWMIYCKAPFDPELSASTSSNYYMNVDYFMQPSLRNFGFNVKVQF